MCCFMYGQSSKIMTDRVQFFNNKWLIWIPTGGICVFVGLYLLAASMYPGGSNVDQTAEGFSWINNYWCDLLSKWAKNGQPNPASSIAIAAMTMLCLALSAFWYLVPRLMRTGEQHYRIVQFSGIGSMLLAIFVFSNYHDFIILLAVVLGIVALSGTYVALYRSKSFRLLGFGITCLLMIIANSYIYYSKNGIQILPLLQKVTFLLYLLWIFLINIQLWRKSKF